MAETLIEEQADIIKEACEEGPDLQSGATPGGG